MHMYLKVPFEGADDKDDEDDHALQETMTNKKPFPGKVEAVDRTGGHAKIKAPDFPGSSRFTFGHGVRGDPATHSLKRSHETPERELLAWSWVLLEAWLHWSFGTMSDIIH
jgi:hypothetical protein